MDMHKTKLARGSKDVINPKNNDEECFKYAIITAVTL